MTLGIVLLATMPLGQARGADPAPSPWSPSATAKYLDQRGDWWLGWSGSARGQGTACISCHTALSVALARPALGAQLGETAASAVEERLHANLVKRVESWEKIVGNATSEKNPFIPYYAKERKPSALGTESVLNALLLVRYDARRAQGILSEPTRKALDHLWGQQQENGAWLWLEFGLRPWETDAVFYGASLAALAVGTAGKDYYERADVKTKVGALTTYLQTQFPKQSLHNRVVGLWASSRLPGFLTEEVRKKLIEELLGVQEADGSWSLAKLGKKATGPGAWKSHGAYPEGGVGDGYATGLAVLALKRAGVAADNPQLAKSIGWLVSKQQEGTWPVNYPNRPRDPQNDVGKFMRDAAAAFAILALTDDS
jgi:squalene-hopene/tetraprenyl-beta-curcumene cyclase